VVYKAFDTRLKRPVAIKILPSHLVADEKNLLRFTQEAQAASALNHPNICTIHEIDEENSIHFIVMEFVDGETLRQILERRGPLPEQEVIDIGMKVADALKAAHAKGNIHRDIKPENNGLSGAAMSSTVLKIKTHWPRNAMPYYWLYCDQQALLGDLRRMQILTSDELSLEHDLRGPFTKVEDTLKVAESLISTIVEKTLERLP
jgi:hypothetical protein